MKRTPELLDDITDTKLRLESVVYRPVIHFTQVAGRWLGQEEGRSASHTGYKFLDEMLHRRGENRYTLVFDKKSDIEAFGNTSEPALKGFREFAHLVRSVPGQSLILTLNEVLAEVKRTYPNFMPARNHKDPRARKIFLGVLGHRILKPGYTGLFRDSLVDVWHKGINYDLSDLNRFHLLNALHFESNLFAGKQADELKVTQHVGQLSRISGLPSIEGLNASIIRSAMMLVEPHNESIPAFFAPYFYGATALPRTQVPSEDFATVATFTVVRRHPERISESKERRTRCLPLDVIQSIARQDAY